MTLLVFIFNTLSECWDFFSFQEAQVLSRVAELRRQGLWSVSRLPMIEMPPRNKTHHDYLLEEMRWMALDFRQERIFKRQAAKKVDCTKFTTMNSSIFDMCGILKRFYTS